MADVGSTGAHSQQPLDLALAACSVVFFSTAAILGANAWARAGGLIAGFILIACAAAIYKRDSK